MQLALGKATSNLNVVPPDSSCDFIKWTLVDGADMKLSLYLMVNPAFLVNVGETTTKSSGKVQKAY